MYAEHPKWPTFEAWNYDRHPTSNLVVVQKRRPAEAGFCPQVRHNHRLVLQKSETGLRCSFYSHRAVTHEAIRPSHPRAEHKMIRGVSKLEYLC